MNNEVRSALIKAREALTQVETIEHTNWIHHSPGYYEDTARFVEACAWCHTKNGHSDSCQRQIALATIEKALDTESTR